jgi:O-antigen/teichoic acid export membrane protein
MFGLMAIATVVMISLAMFSDLGLKQSIIQSRRGSDPTFLNTAWLLQIVRGALLWFLSLGIALLIPLTNRIGMVPRDSVYANQSLPFVIAILSFTLFIDGFRSTKWSEVSRNLALGRITLIEIVAQIAGMLCMLGWVYVDRSIWAMVAGSIFSELIKTILSHIWLPGVANRWQWDRLAVLELVHFGKWMFLSSVLGFLVGNSDRLILGGMVNTTMLGIYVIAFAIVSSVEQVLSRIIVGVMFPALSEIARERPTDLKERYYRIHAVVASFAYFCSGVLIMSGQSLIGLLYDPRYAQAGWMLEVLAAALLTVPFQISIQCFMALGMPQLHSNILVIRLVMLFAAMPVGFHFFGLPGALWGLVLSQFLCLPMIILYSARHGLFDLRKELLLLPMVFVGMGVGKVFALVVDRL